MLTLETILSEDKLIKSAKRTQGFIRDFDSNALLNVSQYWDLHGQTIVRDILDGTYRIHPYIALKIRKSGGRTRHLAVPTPLDMMLQRVTADSLSETFNKSLSVSSFGFRKGKSTQQVIEYCKGKIREGYRWIAKIDIADCFGTICIAKLMQTLHTLDIDGNTFQWLAKILAVPLDGKTYFSKRVGISQGSPLSPFFANMYLNEFDRYLEQRHIPFARYADDIVVFSKTEHEVRRLYDEVSSFLEKELRLTVSPEKKMITNHGPANILGYELDFDDKGIRTTIPDSSINRLMNKTLMISRMPLADNTNRFDRLGAMNRGWVNYFAFCDVDDMKEVLTDLDDIQTQTVMGAINITPESLLKSSYVSSLEWYNSLLHRN